MPFHTYYVSTRAHVQQCLRSRFMWVCIISAIIPGTVCMCLGVCAFY